MRWKLSCHVIGEELCLNLSCSNKVIRFAGSDLTNTFTVLSVLVARKLNDSLLQDMVQHAQYPMSNTLGSEAAVSLAPASSLTLTGYVMHCLPKLWTALVVSANQCPASSGFLPAMRF